MCKVHDGEPELARLSRLRKSQIKGLLVPPRPCSCIIDGEAVCHARASSDSKASCRSATARRTAPPARATGSGFHHGREALRAGGTATAMFAKPRRCSSATSSDHLWASSCLQTFVRVLSAEEVGVADKEILLVIIGIDEPSCDALCARSRVSLTAVLLMAVMTSPEKTPAFAAGLPACGSVTSAPLVPFIPRLSAMSSRVRKGSRGVPSLLAHNVLDS
jgi:hypothetical protein